MRNSMLSVCSSCRLLLKAHACCLTQQAIVGWRPGAMANLFQVYGVIAQLALLAAADELEKSLLPASAISEQAEQNSFPPIYAG